MLKPYYSLTTPSHKGVFLSTQVRRWAYSLPLGWIHEPKYLDPLLSANGRSIRTYGTHTLSIHLPSNTYRWTFLLADVTRPMLGADFLHATSLLVKLKGKRLVDAKAFHSTPLHSTELQALHLVVISTPADQYTLLLGEFHDIVTLSFVQSTTRHTVEHFITTNVPPIHASACSLSPQKLLVAKAEFDRMEAMGIVRRSSSSWASPLYMVPNTSGGWHPCNDYRCLNNVTAPDQYLVLYIHKFLHEPFWHAHFLKNRPRA